ncbi:MAG: hypothetical protein AB7O21_20340 [Gammaproteobacteria bacterium]
MNVDLDRNPRARRALVRAWWITGLLAVVCVSRLGMLDRALVSPVSPLGILDLQFAGSASALNVIRDTWLARGVLDIARESLLTDFPFMVCYGLNLVLAVALWGTRPSAHPMMGVAAACVPFDAAENLLQIGLLEDGATTTVAQWNMVFVIAKFGCVIATLLTLGGVVWRRWRRAAQD